MRGVLQPFVVDLELLSGNYDPHQFCGFSFHFCDSFATSNNKEWLYCYVDCFEPFSCSKPNQ